MTAPIRVLCPYCGKRAKRVTGAELYPKHPACANRGFWVCYPCDARVGTHLDGRPLGTLADGELRGLRKRVHDKLDPIWLAHRDKGRARKKAYQRLADALGITVDRCHVGEFDVATCHQALAAIKRGEVQV